MQFVAVLAMFVVPLLAGVVFGFVQLAFYRIVLRRAADAVPAFFILFARGLLAFFLIAAVLAVSTRLFTGSTPAG